MNDTPANTTRSTQDHGDTTVASAVLLYHLDGTTVTASLLSPVDGSDLGATESIELENFSPEQIGLTVPVLWDLVDVAEACVLSIVTSGAAADIDVAPPILELAFGVPVFASPTPSSADEPDADGVAPWKRAGSAVAAGAARSPLRPTRPVPSKPMRRTGTGAGKTGVVKSAAPKKPSLVKQPPVPRAAAAGAAVAGSVAARPPVEPEIIEPEVIEPEVLDAPDVDADVAAPAMAYTETDTEVFPAVVIDQVDPSAAATESIPVVTTLAAPARRMRSRRAVGLAGVAAAAALVAAGIGTAAVMSGGSDAAPQTVAAEQQQSPADAVAPVPSAAAPSPAAPAVPPPAPVAPAAATDDAAPGDAAPDDATASWTDPATEAPAPWTPTAVSPSPAAPAPTWTSPSAVPPPQFTVPVPAQDPDKSPQQLQDEAWARHWQQTGQWIDQEFGN